VADYEPVQRLGIGGFGLVLKACHKLVDIHYAVKRIPISSSAEDKAKVLREVQAHARLNNKHIVRYYDTWFESPPPGWQASADIELADRVGASIHDPGWTKTDESDVTSSGKDNSSDSYAEEPIEFLYIKMELCEHGTLKDWMEQQHPAPPEQSIIDKIFYQMCKGVKYIHGKGLIHRDLKPSNIYLAENLCVKIGDFGLTRAKLGVEGHNMQQLEQQAAVAEEANRLTDRVGTQLYMSPEQCNQEPYNHKVDIFSLGLILLELLVPFTTDMERCKVLTKAKEVECTNQGQRVLPRELTTNNKNLKFFDALLLLMLNRLGLERPEAAEIMIVFAAHR
jgi:translation initiation factor 2-alpha kinase 3